MATSPMWITCVMLVLGLSVIDAKKNDGWIPITSAPAIHRYRSYIDSRISTTTTSTTPAPSSSSTADEGLIAAGQRAAAIPSSESLHHYGYAIPEQDYHHSPYYYHYKVHDGAPQSQSQPQDSHQDRSDQLFADQGYVLGAGMESQPQPHEASEVAAMSSGLPALGTTNWSNQLKPLKSAVVKIAAQPPAQTSSAIEIPVAEPEVLSEALPGSPADPIIPVALSSRILKDYLQKSAAAAEGHAQAQISSTAAPEPHAEPEPSSVAPSDKPASEQLVSDAVSGKSSKTKGPKLQHNKRREYNSKRKQATPGHPPKPQQPSWYKKQFDQMVQLRLPKSFIKWMQTTLRRGPAQSEYGPMGAPGLIPSTRRIQRPAQLPVLGAPTLPVHQSLLQGIPQQQQQLYPAERRLAGAQILNDVVVRTGPYYGYRIIELSPGAAAAAAAAAPLEARSDAVNVVRCLNWPNNVPNGLPCQMSLGQVDDLNQLTQQSGPIISRRSSLDDEPDQIPDDQSALGNSYTRPYYVGYNRGIGSRVKSFLRRSSLVNWLF